MTFLNKVIACILCFTLILNLSTVAYGTESVNSPNEIHSYTVKVTSNEYSGPSVTFYEFEGKYYLALDDIKDFTRCTLTEDTETITLTHGLRELVINKSTGQMVDSGMVDQGNISLLNYNGIYLCEGIPMLQYLGAMCSIRNEKIEILMPSFTIWESIMPDYLDYYFNINELYGGEDNVKISLILDIIADVLDGVSGHGLMANADMHLEDALYEILNVDMMKYINAQDAATTLNQKINNFLSSAAFSTALDTGDNTYDAVYEALDYYVKFYISGKNDILLDMMTQTDDLEYASDLASQIQKQVYSQSAAKANLKSAKTAQSFMDVGMLAFDTAITSYSMMQYDDDTRNLFVRTINQEMFEYADYYDITWNNVSDKISNTLKSTQSIVANTAIENVTEFAVKKATEEGAKSALSAFTSKANIYAAAVQIGFFVASLINYESNQAFSADMNAIWLSAVQYDIAMLASSLLVKERDEFHFSSVESLEKLKDMFTLYYRTTIAFSENIAKSIEEFGSKSDQEWVEWFSSTTENSVANYAAEYLYRITNCTIVPIVDFSEIRNDLITYDWISSTLIDDSVGKQLSSEYIYETDGKLTSIKNYEYNGLALLQSITTWTLSDSENHSYWYASDTISYKYDTLGNMIQEINCSSYSENTIEYEYDTSGNLLSEHYRNSGISREYHYNDSGNLIQVIGRDASGAIQDATEYAYDNSGNRISSIDYWYSDGEQVYAEEHTSEYDDQGHILSTKAGDSEEDWTIYTYDDSWNLVKKEWRYGDMSSSTVYIYDEHNRLISEEKEEWGYKVTTTYTYDSNNNIITKNVSDQGHTVYNYVTALDTESNDSWKAAYLSYVRTELDDIPEETRFYLVDIDGDSIPELYIDFLVYANGMKLCSFDGSNVNATHLRGWGAVSYIPNTGYVLSSSGHHGMFEDNIYCVTNGYINSIASGSWTDMEPVSYYWNNSEVTYEAYNNNLLQIFDTGASIPIGHIDEAAKEIVVGPNPYSYAQIQSILS